jgi:hypothetical protein
MQFNNICGFQILEWCPFTSNNTKKSRNLQKKGANNNQMRDISSLVQFTQNVEFT